VREERYPISPQASGASTAILHPLISPLLSGAYAVPGLPSTLSANRVTLAGRTGMICRVSDPEAARTRQSVREPPPEPKRHWWTRLSPWLWGLAILLAIGATQVPRMAELFTGRGSSRATPTGAPRLSGPVYTQAMVTGRSFIRADLRGARLAHIDLRGKNFEHAHAAGAVFASSLLNGADLSHTDLRGADLRGACLRGANLTGAKLAGADFTGADVMGTTVIPAATSKAIGWASIPSPSVCPRG
jgi:Pentapeptide repeats (8 copies)